jgi:ABC-type nitrate/sulfonate/bicarbonate transport system substrate-binding protein
MQPFTYLLVASLFFAHNVHGQNITLHYGQIPSTLKTVSALQFYLAQRKGFFTREGIALEVLPIEGGAANMVLALSKGIVDITRTATPYLIQDVLNGSENVPCSAKPERRSTA